MIDVKLSCDGCGVIYDSFIFRRGSGITVTAFRKLAAKKGWRYITDGERMRDYCKNCVQKRCLLYGASLHKK